MKVKKRRKVVVKTDTKKPLLKDIVTTILCWTAGFKCGFDKDPCKKDCYRLDEKENDGIGCECHKNQCLPIPSES